MFKYGWVGVLMEVMGLMLGEFVDDYMVGLFFLFFKFKFMGW